MLEKIAEMIREQLHLSDGVDINEETSFQEDLRADSLELLDLITAVEDEYGIKFEDEALENLKTVGDVMEYIRAQGIDIE